MNSKLFEVRDRATFIPVLATRIDPYRDSSPGLPEFYLMRRAGFGCDACVILCRLECSGIDRNATYDVYAWGNQARTLQVAHQYILDHFDELESGAVIDVEFILGESGNPKLSEALTHP